MSKYNLKLEQTDWKLNGSAAGGGMLSYLRAKGGKFDIESIKDKSKYTLAFGGIGGGVGLSLTGAKLSLAMSPLPRAGAIYKLPFAGNKLSLSELCGLFVMYEVSGHAILGGNAYIMFLGGLLSHTIASLTSIVATPVAYFPMLIQSSNAFICSAGFTATTDMIPLDLGATGYVGFINDF